MRSTSVSLCLCGDYPKKFFTTEAQDTEVSPVSLVQQLQSKNLLEDCAEDAVATVLVAAVL